MIGRLVHKADFQRLLGTRTASRSAHFAVHHLAEGPTLPVYRPRKAAPEELSTGDAPIAGQAVDNVASPGSGAPAATTVTGRWLGVVVPKRHARRAVTRNMVRRLARQALSDAAGSETDALPAGLWLVRLRQPLPRAEFRSADSPMLRQVVRDELAACLRRVTR